MATVFKGFFLGIDRGDDAAGEVEVTIGKNGDFHAFIIVSFDFLVKVWYNRVME